MARIEYRCRSCGREFQRIVFRGEEEASVACPLCGAPKAEKMPSAQGLSGGVSSGLAENRN